MTKKINKQEFIEIAQKNTRRNVAKHFGIADITAQRIADELGVSFKKFVPTGRKKIEVIINE